MSQARLYLDEDAMQRSIVFGLRARNVDVLTAAETGMINRADRDHLAAASSSGRALYTFNVGDYCVLHQEWVLHERVHAGIIVGVQQRYPVGEELRRLMRLLAGVSAEELRNRLEFLSSWA